LGQPPGQPVVEPRDAAAQKAVDILHNVFNGYLQPASIGDLPDPVAGVAGLPAARASGRGKSNAVSAVCCRAPGRGESRELKALPTFLQVHVRDGEHQG
jgi:hypothetical protein